MTVLSRMPTRKEMETIEKYYTVKGMNVNFATNDLVWALINSREFLENEVMVPKNRISFYLLYRNRIFFSYLF